MTVALRWHTQLTQLDTADRDRLLHRQATLPQDVRDTVQTMATRIQTDGDDALIEYTERFDDVTLDTLTVPQDALDDALESAPPRFVDAFTTATDQVRAYHEALTLEQHPRFAHQGIQAHQRSVPVPSAGLYVPGGQAAYPSTVAMTAIPAQVAGVDTLTLASPPSDNGLPTPLVLAACRLLDIDTVTPLGGAQAILALGLGTETIPSHHVVAGPGNAYVQAAKQHIAGRVRIDAPAGPSEIAVLAGPNADPKTVAREMIAQAEHAPDTLPVAVCLDQPFADAVHNALGQHLKHAPRSNIIQQALANQGALLTAESLDEAEAFLNELAPEHCAILHEDSETIANRLTGPACIVHGPHARVALTDYAAGPSHVLPTGGHAASYGGLGLDTFTKPIHIANLRDPDPRLVQAAKTLARLEGLDAHADSLEMDAEANR